jgi:ATP synthase protein I
VSDRDRHRRPDMRAALQRDTSRHTRRDVSHRSFWRSLGVLGMVGWPIAVSSVGGVLLGHYVDAHWHTGVRFTLILLTIGTGIGAFIAWQTLRTVTGTQRETSGSSGNQSREFAQAGERL